VKLKKECMTMPSRYLTEALDIIAVAHGAYPDSRDLSRVHTELLAACGKDNHALDACQSFLVRFGVDDNLLALALGLRRTIGAYDLLKQAGSESISLCMIVKDEEACLARCLASAKPAVHELIVVDTGSTDKTVEIATAFGAKVHNFAWNGNFSDARNHALEQAKGAWILVLDADEVIAAQDHAVLRQAVAGATGKNVSFVVTTRNYTRKHPQGWVANDASYPREDQGRGGIPVARSVFFPINRVCDSAARFTKCLSRQFNKPGIASLKRLLWCTITVNFSSRLRPIWTKNAATMS
jgi:hypothetical protein